jgi:hypothetical protein
MHESDEPKRGLVNHLAGFLNKKYAKKWRIDMPKGKYKKIQPEVSTTQEQMEVAAYYQWQHRGCPSNDSLTDWVKANLELTRQP